MYLGCYVEMEYETSIAKASRELRGFAAKEVHMNFGEGYFREWADDEGAVEFAKEYQAVFKKYFGDRITNEINDHLYTAGRSVGYLLVSLFDVDMDIDDMVRIVTSFVNEQVMNTVEWCEALADSFPESAE
jgi:hypothetical protein